MPSKVWTKTLFDHQRLYNIRTNSTIIQTVGSTSNPGEIQAKQLNENCKVASEMVRVKWRPFQSLLNRKIEICLTGEPLDPDC